MPPNLPFHDPAWLTVFSGLMLGVLSAVGAAVAWAWDALRKSRAEHAESRRKSEADHAETRRELTAVRHEITNGHTANLRDDMDGKHAEVLAAINAMSDRIEGMREDHRQLVRRVDESASEHRDFRREDRELRHDVAKLQARVAALGSCAAGDDH